MIGQPAPYFLSPPTVFKNAWPRMRPFEQLMLASTFVLSYTRYLVLLKPVMVPSLEERRRRFRRLAETHPGLVVASALIEGVSTNARAERRIAPLRRNGYRRSDTRSKDPARKGPTQLQVAL